VAIDIGANIGLITLLMAKLVGPSGEVHAFEPNPNLCFRLNKSVSINGMSNVRLHEVALSDQASEATLFVPENNCGEGALAKRPYFKQQEISVQTMRLDDISLPSPVAAMKIDVEGHEHKVLRGAERILRDNPPRLIVMETVTGDAAPIELLKNCGYQIRSIKPSLFGVRVGNNDNAHEIVAIAS
jgi:FkbM family methyltransferase